MILSSELVFAQKYPFSETARRVLRENNFSLEEISEELLSRAGAMVVSAAKNKDYVIKTSSSELLLQEILAFPIAKILVSLQKNPMFYEKFSMLFSKSFLKHLDSEKSSRETALEIARQLKVSHELLGQKDFFVSLPVKEFLKIHFKNNSLKLVNQAVSKGNVFLGERGFCVFLSEVIYSNILGSLPVKLDGIPARIKNYSRQLEQDLNASIKKDFEFRLSGKINPNLFPACMQSMYTDLAQGKNLPHMARFYITTFLHKLGMPQDQIIQLFSKLPNYNEKLTRYHVKRIASQNLAVASCKKIKEQGLCPNEECNVRHPLAFYEKEIKISAGKKT